MKRTVLLLAVFALLAAACGDSADTAAGETAAVVTTASAAPTTAAPTTAAPTTTAAPPATSAAPAGGIVAGEDPTVDAIVTAYVVAFDSVSDYATKVPYIDDPSGLEETVTKYLATGETMGGVGVRVTDVVVNGNEADVTYDLLFNNNPTYPDLPGTAVLGDAGWQVPRSVFCALMSSARVGCPSD